MKPHLIEVPERSEYSFQVLDYNRPYFHNPIHFHSALELTLITGGEGTRFVGDSIENFFEGDLVLLGSNLPHQWRNTIAPKSLKPKTRSTAIVVHFKENCFGHTFFLKPEAQKIHELLQDAKRGLKIYGNLRLEISNKMKGLINKNGFQRTLAFLEILHLISNSNQKEPLSSISYRIQNKDSKIEKLDAIHEYIFQNLTVKVSLSEISSKFHMSRTGFCRYFKMHTQKTFSRFVLEARISMACQLLHENKLNITQIAYESGFNTVSFFCREFKKIKGTTPLDYKKQVLHSIF